MSGVEVVGLLLGAFPLCISAMEHWEAMSKVAGTFYKIRRVHKKDLGKIKDCQLMFKLNIKELLIPLLNDEIVDKVEYEQLLADPGGPAWSVGPVDTALAERLNECHQRYIEILQEMQETMAGLCEACRVNDEKFQQSIRQQQKTGVSSNATKQAQDRLLLKANNYVCFQAKRAQYALRPTKREELLAELEDQNGKLQNVLSATDRVSALTQQRTRTHRPSVNPRMLKFWRHADNIYKLLRSTWHCTCRSCASLWLQQQPKRLAQMSVVLHFCHGRRAVSIELSEKPPTLQLPPRLGRASAGVSSVTIQSHMSAVSIRSSGGQNTATVTCTSQSASIAANPTAPLLERDGLCRILSAIANSKACIGRVTEGDSEYAIFPAVETVSCAQGTSLADLLQSGSPVRLNRVQRYGIALTLASSHLQLHSTPWLKAYWTSDDVLFPTTSSNSNNGNNVATLHGEPYILANISPSNTTPSSPQKDRSFSTLGIVLLELCFGYRLEEHSKWQNPAYGALKGDPMIRQTVACEWLDDVKGEAGEEYANAVDWTLKQSPAVLKDDKWREEFAQNVVQPLQRYYEYLHPTKNS